VLSASGVVFLNRQVFAKERNKTKRLKMKWLFIAFIAIFGKSSADDGHFAGAP
jgi:hypothetical protein